MGKDKQGTGPGLEGTCTEDTRVPPLTSRQTAEAELPEGVGTRSRAVSGGTWWHMHYSALSNSNSSTPRRGAALSMQWVSAFPGYQTNLPMQQLYREQQVRDQTPSTREGAQPRGATLGACETGEASRRLPAPPQPIAAEAAAADTGSYCFTCTRTTLSLTSLLQPHALLPEWALAGEGALALAPPR